MSRLVYNINPQPRPPISEKYILAYINKVNTDILVARQVEVPHKLYVDYEIAYNKFCEDVYDMNYKKHISRTRLF